jgi:phosphatidylglycerol---prolipoprotein diacylglyceryl transferase
MLALFRSIFAPPRDLILIIAAAWLGLTISEKAARRYNFNPEMLNNLVFVLSIAYVAGGRLFYAAGHISAFIRNPASLISLNIALFDTWGALGAVLVTGLVYIQRGDLHLWRTLDALTPLCATLAVGIGFSHLASGAAFGQETHVPWAIELWGAARHPTQAYEILASILVLALLWSKRADPRPGGDFLLFAAMTSISQLIIGSFRGDSVLIADGLRLQQVVAWAVLAAALIGLELIEPDPAAGVTTSKDALGAGTPKRNAARPRRPKSAPGTKPE